MQYEYLKEYGDILKLIRLREGMKPERNAGLDRKLARLVQLKPSVTYRGRYYRAVLEDEGVLPRE